MVELSFLQFSVLCLITKYEMKLRVLVRVSYQGYPQLLSEYRTNQNLEHPNKSVHDKRYKVQQLTKMVEENVFPFIFKFFS